METKQRHTWIISDTHFGHDKMGEYCDRPQDFNQKIIYHWNAMIAPDDLVYHLGDIGWINRNLLADILRGLPGTKILIKGNHDGEKSNWYLNHGFAAVMSFAAVVSRTNMRKKGEHFLYTRVLLSHRPMEIPKLGGYKTINIHGHFHNHPPKQCEQECKCEQKCTRMLTPDHYLFSLESTKYKPVLLNRAVRDGWVLPFHGMEKPWLKN